MKKTFFFIAMFLAFMFAVANLLLFFPPTGYARSLLIGGVRKATGLELAVNGKLTLKLVPTIDLRMEDVVVTNPADAGGKPLLTARALEVGTGFWPLLQGSRDIERVSLVGPRLSVTIDKDGKTSWTNAGGAGAIERPVRGRPTVRDSTVDAPKNDAGAAGTRASAFLITSLTLSDAAVTLTDTRSGLAVEADKINGTLRGVAADNITEAAIDQAALQISNQAAGNILKMAGVSVSAQRLSATNMHNLALIAGSGEWVMPKERKRLTLEGIKARTATFELSGSGAGLVFGSNALTWFDDANGDRVSSRSVELHAKDFDLSALRGAEIKAATVSFDASPARTAGGSPSTPAEVKQLSIAASELARNKPLEATIALNWNNERLAGRARVAAPEALTIGKGSPVSLSLAATKGSLELDGELQTADGIVFRGKAEAAAPALDELAGWLSGTRPSKQLAGPAGATGTVEASPRRIALSSGRIEHGRTIATGSLAVDLTGDRPKLSGTLSSDRLDADAYLGLPPIKPVTRSGPPEAAIDVIPQVTVTEALKAYLRAMLDAPVTRNGQLEADVQISDLMRSSTTRAKAGDFEWSTDKFDLSPLRTFDLDLDLAIKSLSLRGFDIAVPRLKTVLQDGRLSLDGANLSTRGGRLGGKAEIDARRKSPAISTSFKAEGIDVYDLMKSAGVTGLIAGTSSVEARLSGAGTSQREIIASLSGDMKTRMGKGQIIGYDFSSIASWLFGARKYDPRYRTPFTRLDADIRIEKGTARKSVVKLEGPVIGVDGDGTVQLVQQEIDYRAHLKLFALTLFRNVAVRVFGDWSKPSVAPDLFARSPPDASRPAEVLAEVDLKDPELDGLIGQVLDKAGSRGLDPAVASTLRTLQERARSAR